jgi:hypothetical protein
VRGHEGFFVFDELKSRVWCVDGVDFNQGVFVESVVGQHNNACRVVIEDIQS